MRRRVGSARAAKIAVICFLLLTNLLSVTLDRFYVKSNPATLGVGTALALPRDDGDPVELLRQG
jgi:hypothetical protein